MRYDAIYTFLRALEKLPSKCVLPKRKKKRYMDFKIFWHQIIFSFYFCELLEVS